MALIGNQSVLHKSPGRFLSGTPGTLRSNFNKYGMMAGRFEKMGLYNAIPAGHAGGPSCWALPQKPGFLSSRSEAYVTLDSSGPASMGRAIDGDAPVTIDSAATIRAINWAFGDAVFTIDSAGYASMGVNLESDVTITVNGTADPSGGAFMYSAITITIDGAADGISGAGIAGDADFTIDASGLASFVLTAAGQADISFGASGTMYGAIQVVGQADIAITVGVVPTYALGNMTGNSLIQLTDGTLAPFAIGYMEGSTLYAPELTPQNVAEAVWAAIAAANNLPGTMGELLNGAGAGGDPWLTPLPGAYSPGTAGQIIGLLDEMTQDDGLGNAQYTPIALAQAPVGIGSSPSGEWLFDTTLTSGPGSGDLRVNNASLASVTAIFINETTANNGNSTDYLTALKAGDSIFVYQDGAADKFLKLKISIAPVDIGASWTITGIVTDSGGSFGNNKRLKVTLVAEEISAATIADAVWIKGIEAGYSAEEILRLLAAYAAGDASGLDGTAEFTGLDGVTPRIQGTITGNDRAITALDGT
jgi:hypothetical protein